MLYEKEKSEYFPTTNCPILTGFCSIDVDLPVDCDDEYWSDNGGANSFQQPEGKPSSMLYFIWTIKLSNIMASVLRKNVGEIILFLPFLIFLQCSIGKNVVYSEKEWNTVTRDELQLKILVWNKSLPVYREFLAVYAPMIFADYLESSMDPIH